MRLIEGDQAGRDFLANREALGNSDLPEAVRDVTRRVFGAELDPDGVVERILRDVKTRGDEAVRFYNTEIDGVRSDAPLEVSAQEVEVAYGEVEGALVDALNLAGDRIRAFHELQLQHSLRSFDADGVGQRVRPIERVGLYVPGTAVVYPSTVLMTAIPARVAGVTDLIMVTPSAPDGSVSPLKLVAADIAGVSRIFRAGGVQGVAAMAYGTETVPEVFKICGPGNIFVTLAKKRLFGEVGIDGIFGPSETLVVADDTANPELVAVDMLAGAEHDALATSVLITTSSALAEGVSAAVAERVGGLARSEIAQASMDARGAILLVSSITQAIELANEFAPEHLCLHVADADDALALVRNAGCIFVGDLSVESIGDYTAGPSHVMPTGRSAVFSSPLGVHDFLKVTSVVSMRQELVDEVGPAASAIARAEGLTGHAESIETRLKR
jgi:histidinol dehydrogenase